MATNTMIKSVATVTVFSVITRTLAFIFKVYLSRTAGAEIMGLYQISLSVFFLFVSLTSSGLSTVLSRRAAEVNALDRNDKGHDLVTTALAVSMCIAVVTFATLEIASPILSRFISDERAVPMLKIMFPAILSTTAYCIIRGWLWGRKEFLAFSLTELIEEVLRIIFTLLFISGVVFGIKGSTGIAVAFTISDFIVAIVLVILFFKKGGRITKITDVKGLTRPAVPLTLMRVFGSLIGTILSIMLPMRLISAGISSAEATSAVGRIAGMANPLILAPNAIISSLAIVLIPEMSEENVKKNYVSLNKHISNGIKFALLVSGVFMCIYVALGKEICEILYADSVSGEYLQVASWLMLLSPINAIIMSSMNSIGMEKESFFTYSIGTIFMLIALYFLPQYVGIYSVAIANAVCVIVALSGNLYILYKKINLDFRFLKTLVSVSVISIPCIFFTSTIYELCSQVNSVFALIVATCAVGAMYALLAFALGQVDVNLITSFKRKKLQ